MRRRAGRGTAADGYAAEAEQGAGAANPPGTRPRLPTGGGLRPEPELPVPAPGKPAKGASAPTVPQTDTGGLGEKPEVLETTREKELGKMAP
jgi:hypothetical protein